MVGNTDQDRQFQNVALVISCHHTHERTEDFFKVQYSKKYYIYSLLEIEFKQTYLMSDAAPFIHNGFNEVLETPTILMCWAHVRATLGRKQVSDPDVIRKLKIRLVQL